MFFTPRPALKRLTRHGIAQVRTHAESIGDNLVLSLVEEVEAIRDRELSSHEMGVLTDLRAEVVRLGRQAFVDIIDRVIEILENER